MYKILFTERALRDLRKIDKKTQLKIAQKLKEYATNPFKYARKLISPKIGTYRFRIGEFRVVFDIDREDIIVLRIGHRKEIYK